MLCRHLEQPLVFIRNVHGDEINHLSSKRSIWQCPKCGKLIYRSYLYNPLRESDGRCTFGELYDHITALLVTLCNLRPEQSWKTYVYFNDERLENGYFLVGTKLENDIITYHVKIKYWNLFKIPVFKKSPVWDRQDSSDIFDKLCSFANIVGKANHIIVSNLQERVNEMEYKSCENCVHYDYTVYDESNMEWGYECDVGLKYTKDCPRFEACMSKHYFEKEGTEK